MTWSCLERRPRPRIARATHTASAIPRRDLPSAFAPSYGGTGVLSRGDRREEIIRDDGDRQDCPKRLA